VKSPTACDVGRAEEIGTTTGRAEYISPSTLAALFGGDRASHPGLA